MKNSWKRRLLSLLCPLLLALIGCEDLEQYRITKMPPSPPVPPPISTCAAVLPLGPIVHIEVGELGGRWIQVFANDQKIWSSEFPDEISGPLSISSGYLRYMSFLDAERLRIEEIDPQSGVGTREPLSVSWVNHGSSACGEVSRTEFHLVYLPLSTVSD